jgi:hypothetical protein
LTITVVGFSQQYQYGKAFDSTYYNPGWGDMDYAVPESPAFKILGTNPDNILHPTSAKAIALSIGDYFLTSGATIPKSLAVQFSPYLLANRNTSLKEYNKNGFQRFLSRLSLSVGTSVQGSAYSVAEGLNMTILDNTDLKSMTAYTNKLAQMARVDVDFRRQAIGAYTKAHTDLNAVQIMPLLDADSTHTSALSKAIDSLQQKLLDSAKTVDSLSLKTGVSDQQIVNFRDSVKQASWNNAIWQIGIATLQTSSDSLIKNLQFSQIAFWSSTGLPLGPKAQFLFGAKLGFVDSVKWYTNYSLGGRFFYGKNNTKVFLQGEFDHKDLVNSTTITAGCQFNISNGIWGQFAINLVINSSGKVSYQPGFNVGLANKEKKKQ